MKAKSKIEFIDQWDDEIRQFYLITPPYNSDLYEPFMKSLETLRVTVRGVADIDFPEEG